MYCGSGLVGPAAGRYDAMSEFWANINGLERVFTVCALIGGALFVVRLVLQFVGGDSGDSDVDMDVDGDFDMDGMDGDGDVGGGDADISFRLLSFQGLTAFFMMFGLVGLALSYQSKVGSGFSIAGAVVAGLGTVWVMNCIFKAMSGLQSSGTIKMKNAIGKEGTVYLHIPDTGTGKASVSIQNQLKVYNAMSEGSEEIDTGERIKVVSIVSGNVLVVRKVEV